MTEVSLKHPACSRGSRGFIIVAVLWILATLAALAVIYTVYVKESMVGFVVDEERLQAQTMAWAGVEAAVYQLTANPDLQPSRGNFAFLLGKAEVTGEFRTESSRIDLNLAPKEVLAGLFIALGARRDDAVEYADHIVAWRAPAKANADTPNAAAENEVSLYRAAGKVYGPRQGAFQHINELALVLGIPALLVDRALPYLTVYSGQAEVNVIDAAPEVLAALPGLTPERLHVLLSLRAGAPQDILRAQLGMAVQYANAQPSRSNRVSVEVRFDAARRYRSEAVILLVDDNTQPFRVLTWHDDLGTGAQGASGVQVRAGGGGGGPPIAGLTR
jgi:general secretion pathway protein K